MPNINFYRCNICGNIMTLILQSGVERTCCKQYMTKIEPNTTDGSQEKHVPFVTKGNGKLLVTVGSTLHPMLAEHYIELIALDAGNKTDIVYLAPGIEPKAEFADVSTGTVYEYCSIHGLWKVDF